MASLKAFTTREPGWGKKAQRILADYAGLSQGAAVVHEDFINQARNGAAPGTGWTNVIGTTPSYVAGAGHGVLQIVGPGAYANGQLEYNYGFDGSAAKKWGVAFNFRLTATGITGFDNGIIGALAGLGSQIIAAVGFSGTSNGAGTSNTNFVVFVSGLTNTVTSVLLDTNWHSVFMFSDGTTKKVIMDGTEVFSAAAAATAVVGPVKPGVYINQNSKNIQIDDMVMLFENGTADLSWSLV